MEADAREGWTRGLAHAGSGRLSVRQRGSSWSRAVAVGVAGRPQSRRSVRHWFLLVSPSSLARGLGVRTGIYYKPCLHKLQPLQRRCLWHRLAGVRKAPTPLRFAAGRLCRRCLAVGLKTTVVPAIHRPFRTLTILMTACYGRISTSEMTFSHDRRGCCTR